MNAFSSNWGFEETKSSIVSMIFSFWMFSELLIDVIHLLLANLSSANRALFVLWHLEDDLTSEFILFLYSLHKPIPVHTYEVEPMEALIYSD